MTLLLTILLLAVAPLWAQEDGASIRVESLQEVIGRDNLYRSAVISPGGAMIAWDGGDDGLCVYTFASGADGCQPYPDDHGHGVHRAVLELRLR